MIDTVFLDAGGVIVHPNWSRVREALLRHGVRTTDDELAAAEPAAKRAMDSQVVVGATNDRQRGWLYFDTVLEHAGIAVDARTRAALDDLRRYHDARNLWELVPDDVVPALERLRQLGVRTAVVSNANGTLVAHLDRLGLARYFDAVIDSFDVGVEKPDPGIFLKALGRVQGRAATTVHAGDFYHIDVIGARRAGLQAVLVDGAGLYADADCIRVRGLGDLVRWVGAARERRDG